jgi:hypothetical protein
MWTVAMARSLFRGNVSRAGVLLLASLAGLVTWWILLDAL